MNITTLIPAYKSAYLVDLLNGLRLQTVKPRRIVFSDDSPGGAYGEIMMSGPYAALRAGLPLELTEGPRRGAYENVKHLVRRYRDESELVHILFDDDLIYPEFYERHLTAHRSGDFSCSVSRRWSTSEAGHPTHGQPVPAAIAATPHRLLALSAEVVFPLTVPSCRNWLGEFSNAIFRSDCCDLLLAPELAGVSFAGLWDIGAFGAASIRRPICHLQDHLGGFRLGPNQNSSQLDGPMMKSAHLGWVALAVSAKRLGYLGDEETGRCAAQVQSAIGVHYALAPDMTPFHALLAAIARHEPGADDRFVDAWHAFVAMHAL